MTVPGRGPWRTAGLLVAVAVAWAGLSLLVSDRYYLLLLTLVPLWATFGTAWNVFSGYSGLVSFGHAAFFGIGAYTVTLALVAWGLTPWLGIPLGAVLGAVAGAAIGWPTFRLRGSYFALAMLAYPLMLAYLFAWLGYQEMSIPLRREGAAWFMQFADTRVYVGLAAGLLLAAALVSLWVERSRFGLALAATKQNELAAEAAGIDTFGVKMRAMVLSGGMAAAAGGLYAVVVLVVTPGSVFGLVVSAQAMIVALFGGAGTLWGPLIGAAVLVPLGEILQAEFGHRLPGIQGVLYGVAVIAVVLLAPEGIFWKLHDLRRRPAPVAVRPPAVAPAAAVARPLPGDLLLEVAGLSKSYGGVRAVEDVSFGIRAGEIVGIIGPNGAGKTTLFNMLDGVVAPSAGTIRFAGRKVVASRPSQVARLGIGRTFQVVRAFPRLTVLQNVASGALGRYRGDAEAWAAARAAVGAVGLDAHAGALGGTLTNRELRLMELARALAGGPRLLLLDEPLAGLGADDTAELIAVVRGLPAQGITVAIIEHTMQAMTDLVDRFVVLDQGRKLTEGPPGEVLRQPAVIEAYLGRKWALADAAA